MRPAIFRRARVGPPVGLAAILAGSAWAPLPASAQEFSVRVGGHAIAALFHANVTPMGGGEASREIRVVHPMFHAEARWGRWLSGLGTLDLEGLTLERGELAPGAWGEGFVDRRHPHTYFHELVLAASTDWRCPIAVRCRVGGFVGKGFAPFGSDDPMSRPILRYPVNHHLAQVPERAVAALQLAARGLTLEGGLFNGDEPERPSQWPRIGGRFGDSWSVRATVEPIRGLEASGSIARVSSPEHRPGAGAVQHKTHVGLRFERASGEHQLYALVEWARTAELDGFFRFRSSLIEAAWQRARLGFAYRFELTDRPEEQRIEPFRSLRPHLENSILGITRWTLHTICLTATLPPAPGRLELEPLIELTGATVENAVAGAFDPVATYGRGRLWSGAIGVRVRWRHPVHRMGRYGLLATRAVTLHGTNHAR